MLIHFREFLPGDFARVLELDNAAFPEGGKYTADQFHELLSDPEVLCYTIKNEDEYTIGACILKLKKFNDVLHLLSICVDEHFKRLGVGNMMMENILAAAKFLKVSRITLQVSADQQAAIALFSRHNFHTVRELADFFVTGSVGYEMECAVALPAVRKITVFSSSERNHG